MEKTNIERFDEVAAQILAALYEKFPQPTHIDPNVIGALDETPTRNTVGAVFYSKEWEDLRDFSNDTAKWLAEEGYLSERPGRHYSKYTLSAIGLKSLKHVDQPELGSDTLGDKIKKASADGVRATTSKLVEQFFAIGAPLLAKTMGVG
ncbi:hypothetical protein [Pseudomonas sp. D3-10]|uniref:hypothetical protein n=1 Tax=Pseudomonas sp. D3-10 TaxID=2817392 RepID=UPI003DA98AC2